MAKLTSLKNLIQSILYAFLICIFSNAYSQPSVLELKVLQTRAFEIAPEKFLIGIKEMCANYGAMFIGGHSPASLAQGSAHCMGMKGKYQHITKLSFEGKKEPDLGLVVRMRIDSPTGPSYEKKNYDDIAKEIADTVGVQDIPIRLDPIK
jgi:hypothetical protein